MSYQYNKIQKNGKCTSAKVTKINMEEKRFSLSKITNIVCEAAFDPIIICSSSNILDCNNMALSSLGYESKVSLKNVLVSQLISDHFYPKKITKDAQLMDASVMDLMRVKVFKNTPEERLCIVRVKEWQLVNEEQIYTLSIKEASVISEFSKLQQNYSNNFEQTLSPNLKQDAISINNDNDIKFEASLPFNYTLNSILSNNDYIQKDQKLIREDFTLALFNEFSQFFDFLPCLVWFTNCYGQLEFMNKKYRDTLGIESVKNDFTNSIHPEDYTLLANDWNKHFKENKPFHMELRLCFNPNKPLPTGTIREYRWHLIHSVPIPNWRNSTTCRWAHSAQDIHDLKLAKEEKVKLEASEKAAHEASKLKSEFLATMSHEIRTPLFGVVGNACLLKDTELSNEQRELVDSIEFSGRLLMTVIQDVLDFSRIESGKLSIQPSDFSICKLLKHLGQMLKLEACKKGLNFDIKLPNYDGTITADPDRLLQVLTNLTSNAIKFTSKGSVSLDVTLKNEEENEKEGILNVKVIDTGIGISHESVPLLFTPWTQADLSKRKYYGGSGLGLSICKSLIGLMDGTIGLDSKLGEGTVVWFKIPVKLEQNITNNEYTTLTFAPSPTNYLSPENETNEFNQFDLFSSISQFNNNNNNEDILTLNKLPIKEIVKKRRIIEDDKSISISLPKLNANNANNNNNNNNNFNIMIVEDNPINQSILCKFLDKIGKINYEVISDGKKALDLYIEKGSQYYDIILLDQTLPGLNGDEICNQIRKVDQNQILISISANALLSDQVHFMDIGMNDHISKPVTFTKFKQVIHHWLSKSHDNNNQN